MEELERAFVFADLCGFTALTEAHGDMDAASVAALFAEHTQRLLVPGSELVKTIGDEVMIAAAKPADALRIVRALYNAIDQQPLFPSLRAGVHAGPCVRRDGDYFGVAVNLAARVAGYARAGQIICTDCIRRAADPDLEFRPLGEVRLKNLTQPVALFEMIVAELPVLSGVLDPVCRMRVDPKLSPARISHAGLDFYFCSLACAGKFAGSPDAYVESLAGGERGHNL